MKHIKLFEQYVAEVTQQSVSGTSGRTVTLLDNRKYELKKDVKDAKIGDFINVVLPKDTIILNLPGGVFANHPSLKKYASNTNKWNDTYGLRITSLPNTLISIEKNSKILESLDYLTEGVWANIMKGVKPSQSPWSIVAIEYNKVVGQSNDIKIPDLVPAKYEALKREYPKARIHIEDGGGQVVWTEKR